MSGYFELKQSKSGMYFFNFLAGNGQILLNSEMYETKFSARHGIESVMKTGLIDSRYELAISKSNKPYFVLKAGNHQVIMQSQQFESEDVRDNSIQAVKHNIIGATIEDLT